MWPGEGWLRSTSPRRADGSVWLKKGRLGVVFVVWKKFWIMKNGLNIEKIMTCFFADTVGKID